MRRRRALVLLGLALACGGLASSQVRARVQSVEARVGPLVPVLVTTADVPEGSRLGRGRVTVARVPERFAPRDALTSASEARGLRTAVALAAGSYVTVGSLDDGSEPSTPGPPLHRGERALELRVAGGEGLRAFAGPGTRVDGVISSEAGGGRSYVALEDVELLDLAGGAAESESGAPAALATLRVTLRQAVLLTAAENFGREIRLLARPPRDRRRSGGVAVPARAL